VVPARRPRRAARGAAVPCAGVGPSAIDGHAASSQQRRPQ
jgi:hypothetical protein